ncbi:MAG: hypothetical protein M1816_007373 [Peltula sp. TS41687]|nr:MAG: hypothetical protein M1816_007373 [Peltula sp. TS41687]
MFRFHKSLDVITLFHKPTSASSNRVLGLLKQVSAATSEGSMGKQSNNNAKYSNIRKEEFDLNVTEEPPTLDQLRSILEYVGVKKAGELVKGARDESDAMKKLKENADTFQRPVTVDWNNGNAVVGDNESDILRMLKSGS